MLDQFLIAGLFFVLVASLIFGSWPAVWVFASAMLAAYFLGLVDTAEVFEPFGWHYGLSDLDVTDQGGFVYVNGECIPALV